MKKVIPLRSNNDQTILRSYKPNSPQSLDKIYVPKYSGTANPFHPADIALSNFRNNRRCDVQ